MNTKEIFEYAEKMEQANYPIDHRECVRCGVTKFVAIEELWEMYSLFNIDYEQLIEDLSRGYLKYKADKIYENYKNIKKN